MNKKSLDNVSNLLNCTINKTEDLIKFINLDVNATEFTNFLANLNLAQDPQTKITVAYDNQTNTFNFTGIGEGTITLSNDKFRVLAIILKELPKITKLKPTFKFTNTIYLPPASEFLFSEVAFPLEGLNNLNTSNVLNLYGTFLNYKFPINVSSWDVSKVTNMQSLFEGVETPVLDLNSWDVSNVTSMRDLFACTMIEDLAIAEWNVSAVKDMHGMFMEAYDSNPDVSKWNVSSCTDMSRMFMYCDKANPQVANWDVSAVTDMSEMFAYTEIANPDTTNWQVQNVLDFTKMFYYASEANPNVSHWRVTTIELENMFTGASKAFPDVDCWDSPINYLDYLIRAETDGINYDFLCTGLENELAKLNEDPNEDPNPMQPKSLEEILAVSDQDQVNKEKFDENVDNSADLTNHHNNHVADNTLENAQAKTGNSPVKLVTNPNPAIKLTSSPESAIKVKPGLSPELDSASNSDADTVIPTRYAEVNIDLLYDEKLGNSVAEKLDTLLNSIEQALSGTKHELPNVLNFKISFTKFMTILREECKAKASLG